MQLGRSSPDDARVGAELARPRDIENMLKLAAARWSRGLLDAAAVDLPFVSSLANRVLARMPLFEHLRWWST
jgi:hypothetical protein